MSESSYDLSHCDRKRSAHSTSGVRTIPDSMMRPAHAPSQRMHQFSQYGLLRNSETQPRANVETLSFDVAPCRHTQRRSRVESETSSGPDQEPNVAPIRGPINSPLLGGHRNGAPLFGQFENKPNSEQCQLYTRTKAHTTWQDSLSRALQKKSLQPSTTQNAVVNSARLEFKWCRHGGMAGPNQPQRHDNSFTI